MNECNRVTDRGGDRKREAQDNTQVQEEESNNSSSSRDGERGREREEGEAGTEGVRSW